MRSVFLLLLLLCMGIAPVFACSPTATPQGYIVPVIGLSDYVQQTPVIFVGTVLGEVERPIWGRRYEIQVERYLKGSGYNIVQIDGYGDGADCLPLMIWGESTRIFFVREHQNSAGIPVYYRVTEYALGDEAAIVALTGGTSAPQALPLDIQFSRLAENGALNWFYIGMSLFAALIGLLAVGLSLRLRGRRKSKAKRDVIG